MSARRKTLPFGGNLEYLSAFLDFLSELVRRQIVRRNLDLKRAGLAPAVERPGVQSVRSVSSASRREERRLEALLSDAERNARRKEAELAARVACTLEAGAPDLPLERLAREHGLGEFEKRVLALVLGPTLDNRFRRLLEDLGAAYSVEIRVALDVLCESVEEKIRARRCFSHGGSLLGRGLLNLGYGQTTTENGFLGMDLELPRRISSLILGEHDVDNELITFSRVVDPQVDLDQVVLPQGKLQEVLDLLGERETFLAGRKAWGFDRILAYGRGTVLLFAGPSGAGKTMFAHALAKASGHRLMLVDIRSILYHSRRAFEDNLQRAFHEARLQHAILFFDEADEMFSDRSCNAAMPALLREFEKFDGIAILATNRKQVLDEALERRILYKLDFEVPSPALRETIWRKHLPPEAPLAPDVDLKALAEDFEFTGGFIKNAVLMAAQRALKRKGDARRIEQADLRAGAQLQRRNRLESYADRIAPRVNLSDLILPPPTRAEVEAIVAAARKRLTVYSTWGFGQKLSGGKALSSLFAGPSGTGKTMAAEAIASELGQCLYPVRVSTILSMWIGETEKNIARVFRAARESQAILFFDEADALFGRRIGNDSAQGAWINKQIDVLLTEMERFDGIVILATNLPDDFDDAFERRLCYRVSFALPDAAAREAIWRGLIPSAAPLAPDVDFATLARAHAFSGGTIKNVVLRAAFAAATSNEPLSMALLNRCAAAERPLREKHRIGFMPRHALPRRMDASGSVHQA